MHPKEETTHIFVISEEKGQRAGTWVRATSHHEAAEIWASRRISYRDGGVDDKVFPVTVVQQQGTDLQNMRIRVVVERRFIANYITDGKKEEKTDA